MKKPRLYYRSSTWFCSQPGLGCVQGSTILEVWLKLIQLRNRRRPK